VFSTELTQQVKLNGLVSRPQLSIWDVLEMSEEANSKAQNLLLDHEEIVEQAEIQIKYEGYIQREEEQVNKQNRLEEVAIPVGLDYTLIKSLSIEAKEKLSHIKPVTIGQAARVSNSYYWTFLFYLNRLLLIYPITVFFNQVDELSNRFVLLDIFLYNSFFFV